jgi:stage V sporulation protein G
VDITEVRVKLVGDNSERLKAFCSVTFDGEFVVRDLKVIDGPNGPFLAMPSRKLTDRCPKCRAKNHLRAKFCSNCGQKLDEQRANLDPAGRAKLHADVAHPIHAECRKWLQEAVVRAYLDETNKSEVPGYQPPQFDDFDDYEDVLASLGGAHKRSESVPPKAPEQSEVQNRSEPEAPEQTEVQDRPEPEEPKTPDRTERSPIVERPPIAEEPPIEEATPKPPPPIQEDEKEKPRRFGAGILD